MIARLGDLGAVATRDPDAITLFDPNTGQVSARIRTPAPARHLEMASARGPLLFPAGAAGVLLELDLRTRRLTSIRVGSLPHDAAAVAGRVFVGNEFGRSVSVVSGHRAIRTLTGFSQPGGLASLRDDVAVVDVGANTLTVIDAQTLHVLGRANAGAGPTHVAADPASDTAYVIDTRGDAVLDFRLAPDLREQARLPLPGTPYGVAIDPGRHRLWVTLTARNELVELSTEHNTLRRETVFPTVRQPNTVAVQRRTGVVFVASAADGTVERIDPR